MKAFARLARRVRSAPRSMLLASALALTALASPAQNLSAPAAPAQNLDVPASPAYLAAHARWKGVLAEFANADKQQLPGDNGVLFVGSSSIRLWTHLARDFRQQPIIINRGFGGSTMDECSMFARELVVRYKPRQVMVYAGDNDLAQGRTPLQVLESFAHFANAVRSELPNARISFISIKPSPAREQLLGQVREANNAIAAYLTRLPNSEYIDIYTPMIGADGRPRGELFLGDRLHLNEEGYRLWQSIIAQRLPTDLPRLATAPSSIK